MSSNSPESAIVQAEPRTSSGLTWAFRGFVLLAFLVYLYSTIIPHLIGQWWNDPNFSHGFFVPAFSAYLIWKERKRLATIPLKPSWTGILIVFFSLGILTFGILGAELFSQRSSLVFLIAGFVVTFLGWDYFRAVFFPWAFLFLMIPIPEIILNQITMPLQFLASRLASSMLTFLNVPVLRDGNVIHLPDITLQVVEACSGIRSLVSLGTLAIIYGYLLESSIVIRVLLVAASVPIAVIANGLRIMGTGLTGLYWDPDKAQGFFHEFSGWVIFIVSLLSLFLLHGLLRIIARRLRRSHL
ncbi:MAG TPA: exosortase A [Terriglobia bacterium]|nr:exosortase A [Terriglobia bacterium]